MSGYNIITEETRPVPVTMDITVTFSENLALSWKGFEIEGYAPHVPEDGGKPGWVNFHIDNIEYEGMSPHAQVASHLFALGFTAEFIVDILENF